MAAKSRIRWGRILLWYVLFSAVLLVGSPFLKWSDKMLYNAAAPYVGLSHDDRMLHLLAPGEKQPVSDPIPVETVRLECPTVGMVDLRPEQLKDSFAAVEWSAQDFAALLKKISETGVRQLAISAPFIWEGGTQSAGQFLLCATLNNKKLFDRVVLGMRGRTTAQADLTPIQFRSYVIPTSQVKGDTSLLPSANRQVENDLDTADETTALTWAPDWIDDEELTQNPTALEDRSFPLLVRWNGEILPTLPLRLALEIRNCPIEKVQVELGKEIRLDTLVLPIDSHGRVTVQGVAVQALNLTGIIEGTEKLKEAAQPHSVAVLMQPLHAKEPAERLKLMASSLSQLCAQEIHETVIRPGVPLPSLWYAPLLPSTSVRIMTVLLVLLAALRIIPSMPFMLRALTMLGSLAWVLYMAWERMLQGQWFHLGSILVVWCLFVFIMPTLKPLRKKSIFSSPRR